MILHKKTSTILTPIEVLFSDPGRVRTVDPMIKSHLLYQLSYGVILLGRNNNFPFRIFQVLAKKVKIIRKTGLFTG